MMRLLRVLARPHFVLLAVPFFVQLVFGVFVINLASLATRTSELILENAEHCRLVNQLRHVVSDAWSALRIPGRSNSSSGVEPVPELFRRATGLARKLKDFSPTKHQRTSFSDIAKDLKREIDNPERQPVRWYDAEFGEVLQDLEVAQKALLAQQEADWKLLSVAVIVDLISILAYAGIGAVYFGRAVSQPVRRISERLAEGTSPARDRAEAAGEPGDLTRLDELSQVLLAELYALRFREVSLAANSKQIIVSLDRDTRVKKSNPFTREFFKFSPDLPELRLVDYLGEDADYFAQTLTDMADSDEPLRRIELAVQDGAGRNRDLEWTLAWSTSDGSFFCVANDVTATRQADRFKDEMLMTLSHDIRSPLAAAITTIERIVRLEDGAESSKDKLLAVKKTLMSIASLSEDLLDIDQLQTGQLKLEITAVSVLQLVSEVADSLKGLSDEKGISVRMNPANDVRILCDLSRAKQVLANALSNGIKFSPPGGDINIEWLVEEPGYIKIGVEDSGGGIAEAVQSAILSGTPVASQSGGRGLGLRISKMLTERMGGRIGLNSSQGGTLFWFTLPLAPDQH